MNSLSAEVSVVPKENNAYLLNPGNGWIIYSSFANASTAAWAKASVGYARYMWKDIHTEDNTFNWAPIDNDWKPGETIAQAAEFVFPKNPKGTKLALGVFTRESLANPDIRLGIDHATALNWYVLSDMLRGME